MAIRFDDLPIIRQQGKTQNQQTTSLSFDDLPSVNYATSDDDIRFKVARGMSSQLFSTSEGNARILADAKKSGIHPKRLLRSEAKKIASELPADFNYKALDPLGILDGQQSLNRFSAAKENKPLKGFSYKDEAEGIFNQFDEQNISTAVSKLKSVFPDAGFDKKRPSQVLADARQRFYPELDPTTFMRQMGAVPRSKDNPAYTNAEPKELSLSSAMWNAVKTGATAPVAGAVRAYADYTGDETLANEAQSVTEGTQEDMTDAMRGRSGAGKVAVSVANSAPLMALSYATGGLGSGLVGVGAGTAAMAAGSGIQKYGSNRAEGFSVSDSAKNAAVTGAAEGAFEAIPLGKFLRPAGSNLSKTIKRIGSQAGTEAVSEALTSVTQDVADHTMLGKEMTADSLLNNAVDSAIAGGVMGAGFGGVAAIRDKIKRRTLTGEANADSGASFAESTIKAKMEEALLKNPQLNIAQQQTESAPQDKQPETSNNNNIDALILRQAQSSFDKATGAELDALRTQKGRSDVQLGPERTNQIASEISDNWGVSVEALLGANNFSQTAKSLNTTPEEMLERSQNSDDVIPQPIDEIGSIAIGPSNIHGDGVIATNNLGKDNAITLSQGLNRTEAGQFINHSNTPNSSVKADANSSAAIPNQKLNPGEELTIDYTKEIPKIRDAVGLTQEQIQLPQEQNENIKFDEKTAQVAELSDQISAIRNGARNRMLKTSEKNKITELTTAINALNKDESAVTNDALPAQPTEGLASENNQTIAENGIAKPTEHGNVGDIEKPNLPRVDGVRGISSDVIADNQGSIQSQSKEASQGIDAQNYASAALPTNSTIETPEQENIRLRGELDKYRREARTQDITKLPNRRQFDEDVAVNPSRPVAAIDMDGLKSLNDSVGHKAADAVLERLGAFLKNAEIRGSKSYHLSGDEFAVTFDDEASANEVMGKLQEDLENVEVLLDTPSGQYVYRGIGISFGVGENYAKADEFTKADKQRRLQSGKREEARAAPGQGLPAPRRLSPIAAGNNLGNVQGRDIQEPSYSQTGSVVQPTTQSIQQDKTKARRIGLSRQQVFNEVSKSIGKRVSLKLEKQPWFNVVDSVDDLPSSILKSIDDAQNTQGFVTPDGNVYIVAGNIDSNPTGVVLHEVGVHYGMRGVLGKDFVPTIERFKSLRNSNKKVQAAYGSVPEDTATSNIDEEALAYYVEDNWATKAPLMQRITDAIKAFANRLGIPLSKLNASPELLVQIAKGATKMAASGRVRFNGGDTMRSTVKPKWLPSTINIDGVERSTTNSNGQPIAETEEGVRNFWKWFGESKVVDADGRPLVVYHGTDKEFSEFSNDELGKSSEISYLGHFFTPSKKIANFFTKNDFSNKKSRTKKGALIIPSYIKAINPFYINVSNLGIINLMWIESAKLKYAATGEVPRNLYMTSSTTGKLTGKIKNLTDDEINYYKNRFDDEFKKDPLYFERNGILTPFNHDGMVIKSWSDEYTNDQIPDNFIDTEERQYVAFNPNQIKSATGNSGDFSSSNPDIRYSRRRQDAVAESVEDTIDVDGVQRPTTNSNGKPIAQDDDSIRNFWRWFADSKVVDEQGRPMVVYHGTAADFDEFNNSKTGSNDNGMWGRGHYFAASAETASSYALRQGDGARLVPAYLAVKNPLILQTGSDLITRMPDGTNVKTLLGQNLDGAKVKAIALSGGNDGVIQFRPNGLIGDVAAYQPSQIKSATGNSGEFSSENPDIRYSKRRTPKEALVESKNKKDYVQKAMPTNVPAEWDWSDATKARGQGYRARITKLREQVQDRMLVFRDARNDIETQKDALSEASDIYTLENLASGKAGDRIAILEKRYAEPLIKKMKDTGVSPEFLEDYLEAKHAIERNDGVAKINPDMPDFGSGMGTKEAQDFLDGKTNGMRSDRTINAKDMVNLESLAKSVYSVTANTRKALLDSGIIDKAKFDAMEASYKYYVPLRGKDGIEPGFERIGTGIRRVKDPIKRALGRGEDNRAQNILGEVFADAQRAIILSEKANVDQGLLRMALEYPNASAYEVEPVKVEQAFSEAAGEVYSAVQSVDNKPGVVIVPYKGRRYRVLLKDERMANAYNKLNAEQLNSVFNFMGSLNRWFSAVLTRYNPSFVAVNMTRDFILGSSSIAAEHGVKTAAKVVKAYFPAMRAIWRDVRGKDAEVGLSKMAREYAEDGGKTSFAISERVEDIQKRIGTEFQTGVNLIASGKPVAAMRKWIGDSSIVAAIEDANDAVENAMRFAAYSVLRQEGMSRQKAAQYAKDLTVNFNRRGQVTTILNSLYLFFNAGVQGGHRTLKLMKDNPGKMSVVLGGIASLQWVLAFMAMGIKDDETGKSLWDSVPDWEKLRNIVIPYFAVSNGKKTVRTVKIPMPYGFNLFSYAGGRAAKLAHDMSNGVDINGGEFVSDMTAGVAGAFSPLPLESQGWSSILPYWANIGLALRTNKDDLGRPITQEQAYAKYEKPRISYGKVDSPQVFKSLAKGLNRLGGGDDFIKPMAPAILDWSPEDLQYIAEKLTGGLGSTVVKSTSLAESLIGGIDVTAKEVPIVSSFFSSVDKATINATTYYDAREKIERDLDRIRASAMGKSGVTPDTEILDMADVRVKKSKSDAVTVTGGTLLKSYRRTEKELRNIRGEMMAVYGDDSISFIQKKLRIKQLQMKRSETQQRFNRQLSELDRK